jgi:2-oxoglutarate dehydrogenase E2 component (dihydrolipoamide succinyltransferase)
MSKSIWCTSLILDSQIHADAEAVSIYGILYAMLTPLPCGQLSYTVLSAAVSSTLQHSSTAAVLLQDGFLEKHGVKLGFMSAVVKASSDALHLVPAVNAVIDGDELVYRDYTDISIAVATPKGLVVPVLRNVDALNFAGIEKVFPQAFVQ